MLDRQRRAAPPLGRRSGLVASGGRSAGSATRRTLRTASTNSAACHPDRASGSPHACANGGRTATRFGLRFAAGGGGRRRLHRAKLPDSLTATLRVAVLAYRGNPHSGGQGVYVHYLTRELLAPRPPRRGLQRAAVPAAGAGRAGSWRCPASTSTGPRTRSARRRWPSSATSSTWLEFATMCAAGFPEPLTFSLRARRALRSRRHDFDVVHDNQCLGYGILGIARDGLPRGGHHPPPDHRRPRPRAGPGRPTGSGG